MWSEFSSRCRLIGKDRTKHRLVLVMLSVFVSGTSGWAQGVDARAPSSVTPKSIERRSSATPTITTAGPKSPRSPDGDKPLMPEKPTLAIRAIVIVKSKDDVKPEGLTVPDGLVVRGIPFLDKPEFSEQIQVRFSGKLLTENAIRELEDAIILYCRNHGKPLVDVILLEQNIDNGVLQLWFLEGKVGKVVVKNEGRKYFRDQLIRDEVRLKPGDSVDSEQLNRDLSWANNNPFRQVDLAFKPGEKLGLTDLELRVEDRFPVRPYLGYENSGTRFTGEDRLLAGFNWGNAFGLDHQFNYQYATDTSFDMVKANSASYIIPLPWRHTLMFYGSYVDAKADFSSIGQTATTSDGTSWQVSMRYSIPLPEIGKYQHELSLGLDFKRANNNLLFNGTNVLNASDTDVNQFVLAYSGLLPDRYGRTSVGAEMYYSPGNLTDYNDTSDFNLLRTGARADYFYARGNVERITRLPLNFSWVLRGWAQVSNARLLPSEELSIGGYNSVRGYDERVVSGDNGWTINNELRTPSLAPGHLLHLGHVQDELQFLAFFDYGGTRVVDSIPQDGSNPNHILYSFGFGLRYTLAKNLSVRFDYGFPLTQESLNQYRSSGHVGVLLSF